MPNTHVPAAGEAMPAAIKTQHEADILRLFRQLSPEKRRLIIQIVHLLVPVQS